MCNFLDGPAQGVTLALRRAPRLLRVVRAAFDDGWDALDQLNDEPSLGEVIHVYRRVSEPMRAHVDLSRPRSALWLEIAEYRHVEPQPSDAEIRTRDAWRAWARANDSQETLTDAASR